MSSIVNHLQVRISNTSDYFSQWIVGVNFNSDRSNQLLCLFIYLGFYVAFNTVQVISRRVVGRAEETST